MTLSRRKILEGSGLVALGAAALPGYAPRLAFRPLQAQGSGDVLVVIFQRGGAEGLNMIPPYGEEKMSGFLRRVVKMLAGE